MDWIIEVPPEESPLFMSRALRLALRLGGSFNFSKGRLSIRTVLGRVDIVEREGATLADAEELFCVGLINQPESSVQLAVASRESGKILDYYPDGVSKPFLELTELLASTPEHLIDEEFTTPHGFAWAIGGRRIVTGFSEKCASGIEALVKVLAGLVSRRRNVGRGYLRLIMENLWR